MSYLLTFCAGLLRRVIEWYQIRQLANRIDQEVSRSWRKQEERASYRNQFEGVSWTWPVKK